MGPYCKFCNRRCFVPRHLGAQGSLILATCETGAAHDLKVSGYTYRTATNPVTGRRDELADARFTGSPNPPYGPTLTRRISGAVLDAMFDLYAERKVPTRDVNATIDACTGLPQVYDLVTRKPRHS